MDIPNIPNNLMIPGAYVKLEAQGGLPKPLNVNTLLFLEDSNYTTENTERITITEKALSDDKKLKNNQKLNDFAETFFDNNPLGKLYYIPIPKDGTKTIPYREITLEGKIEDIIEKVEDAKNVLEKSIVITVSDFEININKLDNDPLKLIADALKVKFETIKTDNKIKIYENESKTPLIAVEIKFINCGKIKAVFNDNNDTYNTYGIESAIAAMGDDQYVCIAYPNLDNNLKKLSEEMQKRFSPLYQTSGQILTVVKDNYEEIDKLFGSEINRMCSSPFIDVHALENDNKDSKETFLGGVAGVISSSVQSDPSGNFLNKLVRGLKPTEYGKRFSFNQRNDLLKMGVSTHYYDANGGTCIQDKVTSYKGPKSKSYTYTNTMFLCFAVQHSIRNFLTNFLEYKLKSDGANIRPGQKTVTPEMIRGDFIELLKDWDDKCWIDEIDKIKKSVVVTKEGDLVKIFFIPKYVNHLRFFDVFGQFRA